MSSSQSIVVLAWLTIALSGCGSKQKESTQSTAVPTLSPVLLTVGSIDVNQADLDHYLKESASGLRDEVTKKKALDELATRAQLTQCAMDAGLENDASVRAEISRILINRLKEKQLFREVKVMAANPIPESRLRELYAAEGARFRSNEKRQCAVLWLNPNGNPEREQQYKEKLTAAREFVFQNNDIKDHPEQGFSVISVDYSEHAASRFKGGIVGWTEQAGGMDDWSKALAEIAFSLKDDGEVSPVISRPQGVFLVRLLKRQLAVQRPFEAVVAELEHEERTRLRKSAENDFTRKTQEKYPIIWHQQSNQQTVKQ